MTPRTVVTALNRASSVGEVFREYPTPPFGRMPVFGKNLDDIVGVVRTRDLLKAKAHDQDSALVEHFMQEVQFIPETATVGNALQLSLRTHNKLLVAVDEFGATSGVVTMEDVIEHLLGPRDLREGRRGGRHARARPCEAPEAGPAPMTPALAFWVDRLDPFLIRFRGNFGIRYYGLAYVMGFVAAAWLFDRYARSGRSLLPAPKIADFMSRSSSASSSAAGSAITSSTTAGGPSGATPSASSGSGTGAWRATGA